MSETGEDVHALRGRMVAAMEKSLSPWAAEQAADLIIADLGLEQVGWWSSLGGFKPMHSHNTHWRPVVAVDLIGRSGEPDAGR
jgi:hypothetical protein